MGACLSAMYSSSSVIILICIERCLAVWYPQRSRYLLSHKTVLRCVWVSVPAIVLICFVRSILYCEIKDGVCHPNFEGSQYSTVLNKMPNTTVYNAVLGFHLISAMAILAILTPLTIVKLFKQRAIRRHLTTKERNSGHFHISVKLTAVLVVYVTLVVLIGIIAIVVGLTVANLDEITLTGLTLALLLNYSTNILLYSIFDGDFRRKALSLFGCAGEIWAMSWD